MGLSHFIDDRGDGFGALGSHRLALGLGTQLFDKLGLLQGDRELVSDLLHQIGFAVIPLAEGIILVGTEQAPEFTALENRRNNVGFGLVFFQRFDIAGGEILGVDVVDNGNFLALDVAPAARVTQVGISAGAITTGPLAQNTAIIASAITAQHFIIGLGNQ